MARNDALMRLHKKLLARRSELRKRLGMELEELAQMSGSSDTADAAFDAATEAVTSSLAEMEARELEQIERALIRLQNGTYGKCENCGQKIPVARLNALPYCTYCIKCQRQLEEEGELPNTARNSPDWSRVRDIDETDDDPAVSLAELERD